MSIDFSSSAEGWIETDGLSPGIEKAMQYVRERFRAPVSVQDVARYSALSYHHLCRKFKKETGRTVVELINWLRIENAKDLLETSPEPIHEIAQQVGFTSTVQFHRTFKKLEADTPMQYRKKVFGEL